MQKLLPEFVRNASPQHLHRFEWTSSDRVGSFPKEWNWLVDEYPHNDEAKILHYTIAIPAFHGYNDCDHSHDWWDEYREAVDL